MADEQHFHTSSSRLIGQILSPVAVVLGSLANFTTIIAIARQPKLRTITNFFLINLAISDLLFSGFIGPLISTSFFVGWYKINESSPELCRIFPYIMYATGGATLFMVALVTLNRYVLIVHAYAYKTIFTKTRTGIILFTTWMIILCLLLLPATEIWGEFGYERSIDFCTFIRHPRRRGARTFITAFCISLTIACVLFCNIRIYLVVRRSRERVGGGLGSNGEANGVRNNAPSTNRPRRKDLKLIKMILTVFGVFGICNIPLVIILMVTKDYVEPTLHTVALMLYWSSSLANPLIYTVMNKQIRLALLSLLPFRKKGIRGLNINDDSTTHSYRQ
ncbi:unnamed protein product [Dimorphilus gyrociliatus]|uniref:G-protein coupled receptors family 1 profile domain-containing protein n=1 Tax=Dimorphilus gyrociliatus TaxID=2664684 RepID=A0A7I8VEV0_9ANNE|nr:unnamed protein product [Dimorphilus gyrociliatus]